MEKKWVTAWSTSTAMGGLHLGPVHLNNGLFHGTARTVLRPTLKGEKIRFLFSNRHGKKPLTLSAVSVGHIEEGKRLRTDKPVSVTFGGSKSVTIAAGEDILSDEIDFKVEALKKIAVSIYVKNALMRTKGLYGGITYLAPGNLTQKEDFFPLWQMNLKTTPATFQAVPFLTRIDVLGKEDDYAIAVVGDSTVFNEVPYMIAEMLHKRGITNAAVIQHALAGNRILDDGRGIIGNLYGENLPDRFDRDVLGCCGVEKIVLKEGVNDIIHPRSLTTKKYCDIVPAEDIIAGLKAIIDKAHKNNMEIYLSPFTPFKGFGKILFIDDFKWSEEAQAASDTVNSWIKEEADCDGVIDIDNLCDESDPLKLKKEVTVDFIHYHAEGQKIFAENVMKVLY